MLDADTSVKKQNRKPEK